MSKTEETLGPAYIKYFDQTSNRNNHEDYTEIIETINSYDYQQMYTHFDTYFNHPIMVKTKDDKNYSMYMTKTYCLLSNMCRYIIVFVPKDNNPVNTKEKLSNLLWESLQTRTLTNNHTLLSHVYQPRKLNELNLPIHRLNVSDTSSTYSCNDLPITITILHQNNKNEYQDKGNIIAALETYQTIITINN
jgi:hypothetical protein